MISLPHPPVYKTPSPSFRHALDISIGVHSFPSPYLSIAISSSISGLLSILSFVVCFNSYPSIRRPLRRTKNLGFRILFVSISTMVNPDEQRSVDDRDAEGTIDRTNGDGFGDWSAVEASGSGTTSNSGRLTGGGGGADEGDGDLSLRYSDGVDRVMQFLQALDLQVMGACRADERLKPLFKLNNATGAAEDRLLAQLSQHFEPSEVGMLARCLCIPLVSVRVGKINKRGTLLCPTASRLNLLDITMSCPVLHAGFYLVKWEYSIMISELRRSKDIYSSLYGGNLNLTLLPTSDLRFSFIGDDGHTERLLTLSNSQCSAVVVEEIPADMSGRSFLIKIPDGEVLYFWCSEKSKLLGNELLTKMKDLLKRKPSLAELTGISESRLDCFATHLRTYLLGSTVTVTRSSMTPPSNTSSDSSEIFQAAQLGSASAKPSRARHLGIQSGKSNSIYQGSLSPRSSSFKEGLPRSFSSLRSVAREKLRRRDIQFSVVDGVSVTLPVTTDVSTSNKLQEANRIFLPSSNTLESLGKSVALPFLSPNTSQGPSVGLSSLFSPYYCWCPPVASTMQYTLPIPSSTESLSLPPLSSFLPAARSSSGLSVTDFPPIDFPPLLPDPLVRFPLPRSSSQQIPTFTPLMCDSIVHIPFIDVCSSGQGYLVSAGPAISTTITPLHPTLVNPLGQETDSVVEKGARETLRLLLSSSSQTNQQLMNVFPSVLTSTDEKQSILVAGSRGFYTGAGNIGAIANSISAIGLVSLPEKSMGEVKRCTSQGMLVDQLEKSGGPGDGEGSVSKFRDERTD
ncbi:hypothetical protein RHGRI_007982 [Rhododendron griersonianum]|uniref:Flocculation protein n=1 Tax=Rhododendron griersonianum TaxID=479676 RepID=A0AAV6L063_9ERIC|nr:hypothetical protein RHGRI_007982 [Rhododendron griersonianum]